MAIQIQKICYYLTFKSEPDMQAQDKQKQPEKKQKQAKRDGKKEKKDPNEIDVENLVPAPT